ncbi:MAG TPA: hypothetical protein VJN18_04580 [Polyangiaceae bacterium]|nr:hypothetical protein [Polyangiaceae bacterium]
MTTGAQDVSVLPLAEDGSTVAFPASAGSRYAVTATAQPGADCSFVFDAVGN